MTDTPGSPRELIFAAGRDMITKALDSKYPGVLRACGRGLIEASLSPACDARYHESLKVAERWFEGEHGDAAGS